jgi:hypothetical protein
VALLVAAGIAATSIGAWAAPIDDARASLVTIVTTANNRNQDVLNTYVVDAVGASTPAELAQLRSRAHSDLDAIWYSAEAQLDAVLDDFPALAGDVANAKAQLVTDHDASHSEVDDTYWQLLETIGSTTTTTTTTTTVPSTTSTTTSSTSTSTSTSTTTTVPSTTTTTIDRATTSTTVPRSTTSTTVPSTTTTTDPGIAPVVSPPRNPPGADLAVADPVMPADIAMASTFDIVMDDVDSVQAGTSDGDSVHSERFLSSMLMSGSAVALPPGFRSIAIPPIVVFEILIATAFDSLGSMMVPLMTLLAASAVIVWRERRRTRTVGV